MLMYISPVVMRFAASTKIERDTLQRVKPTPYWLQLERALAGSQTDFEQLPPNIAEVEFITRKGVFPAKLAKLSAFLLRQMLFLLLNQISPVFALSYLSAGRSGADVDPGGKACARIQGMNLKGNIVQRIIVLPYQDVIKTPREHISGRTQENIQAVLNAARRFSRELELAT